MEEKNNDGLWYKDAVFYELHVRTFKDSRDDGIGDFEGLTSKLDYLSDLGIDCIWLLPFYPSPLHDDGYDVSDFYSIHSDIGTMADFKKFITTAHEKGMKVIIDMVFNHVSIEHEWFQEARKGKENPKHDWFVWSESSEKYQDARIIFNDLEPSNWAWDAEAKEYYWHRFFSHQADLNYDNPEVKEEMMKVVIFWLELGVDGFRCDAVPYLFEREGVGYENVPETHAFFKEVRAMMEKDFPGTILLAEANQWPTEAIEYFGRDDEFHMVFNFPLMPRMFLSVAKGDRNAIVDIIEQVSTIPPNSQWATFLRNHDELTLEMVTDEERDFMWAEYAKHPKMRLNLGIRRRLAPLLDNDRLRMELMTGLLFSLPGSPTIYYGDELGMGDNTYLGDRNGVRTPMQWSPDANGGFSGADPEDLYMPLVINPGYHYESVNVKTQSKLGYSFLSWNKKIIEVRKKSHAFGRGGFRLIPCENEKILAFIREYNDEKVLCIFNLSRKPTYFHLDLKDYADQFPVELTSDTKFPRIKEERPYFFTLTGHRFMWFKLLNREEAMKFD